MAKRPTIGWRLVLQHVQDMKREVGGLRSNMARLEKRLTQKIERMDMRLSTGISNIDARLDAIEIEFLPKRVAVLEAKSA